MATLMRVLGAFTTIYMILIFLRIMLTWFDAGRLGASYSVLSRITDPYLDWFRRFPALRTESMDFSPVAALAVLSVVNNVFLTIGMYGRITVGILLSMVLSSLWSAAAFVLTFFIIVLALRWLSYTLGRNSVLPLWRAVDALSKPLLYRINRIIYRDRLVDYRTALVTAAAVLLAARVLLGIAVGILSRLLGRLPF